jgi:hypothetical protein
MPMQSPCRRDHDHTMYSAAMIQKLRMYFSKLTKVDQRVFVSPGVRCTLDEERIAQGGDLSNVKLHCDWRLESPAILEERLNTALATDTMMPRPTNSQCTPVCGDFLLWAVGRSKSWFNQRNTHHQSRSCEQVAADRVFEIAPEGRQYEERLAIKTRYVTDWLKQQRTEHLIMPTDDTTVLPYMDKRNAHSTFVLDTERLLKFEHADKSVDIVYSNGLAVDDIVAPLEEERVMERDEAAQQCANVLASALPSKSRYGNIVMGPKAAVPECKEIASFSFFNAIWNNAEDKLYKKTIKLRKWMPFAKCDTCANHRLAMAATKCPAEKSRLKCLQHEHLERVKRERLSYLVRQRLSIMYPDRFLSLIIDGADSSTMQIPHLAERSHASDACPKIKMHILGCIAHGRDTYAFTCPPHIAQGHNITIQVIDRVLLDIKKKEGAIPPVLHIQLDNTTKQNKGRYLMAYLAYLVQQGVIKEAYCNFLPVGHTHEDIDQFFSRVSVFTRHHNAPDPETLRKCIRRSYRKYGRSPIVVGWDTVANLSGFFAEYTDPGMSKDITLYYQLRIKMGRNGDIADVPIMQARTWPGAEEGDRSDFWRGLLPDTSYVVVFHTAPRLLEKRHQIPPQAQPQHIGKNPASGERIEYTKDLVAQREQIEKLMEFCTTVFTEEHKTNVRRLLDALGSNLDAWNPVVFDWDPADMEYLYGSGQYVAHAPEPTPDEPPEPNLFDEVHVLEAIRKERPDGFRDPAAFQQAVDDGLINLQHVENVRACVLVVGKFYLQRPPVLGTPFSLVKVVRVRMNEDNKTQWGAWVHPWEVSTTGESVDYFRDPWHASASYKEHQRYDPTKHMCQQGATWTYPLSVLEEFQDVVTMNVKWKKPPNFNKPLSTAYAVAKRNLYYHDVAKVRNFTLRWNEDEAEQSDEE